MKEADSKADIGCECCFILYTHTYLHESFLYVIYGSWKSHSKGWKKSGFMHNTLPDLHTIVAIQARPVTRDNGNLG